MKCTQCGQEYDGNVCPNCSNAINLQETLQQKNTDALQNLTYQTPPSYYQTSVTAQQPPKKKITWWKIVIGALVFLFLVGACFGDSSDEENSYSEKQQNSSQVTEEEYDDDNVYDEYGDENKGYGMLGEYKLSIESAETAYYYKKYLIIVTYEFTNNSNSLASFQGSIYDKAFQDGILLEEDYYYLSVNDEKYYKNAKKDIQKGKTITVKRAYVLENTTDIVDIELKRIWTFSDEKITKSFSLE